MKRLLSLIVLLGLLGVVAGCSPSETTPPPVDTSTNAPVTSTNK